MIRLLTDERGQSTIMLAVVMALVMVGFLALATDIGVAFHAKRIVQGAADAAAVAAAQQSSYGTTNANAAAVAAAKQNGASTTAIINPAVVNYYNPPTWGNYQSSGYVGVTVSLPVSTYFLSSFTNGLIPSLTVTARAVSNAPSAADCVIGLSAAGISTQLAPMYSYPYENAAVGIDGGSSLTATNCGVCGNGASGSGVYASGSGSINAMSINSPGGDFTSGGGSITSTDGVVQTGCSDPYAGKLTAPTPGTCIDPSWMVNNTAGGANETLNAGTYCNFNTSNVKVLTLNPGTYIITKNFSTNSGTTINGTGVTIYIANGALSFGGDTNPAGSAPDGVENGSTLNLTAPTSGNLSGILFWDGNASNTTPDAFTFGGGSGSNITGAIYAPNTNLQLGNGTNTGVMDGMIVGWTVMIQSGSTVDVTATAAQLPGGGPAKLVE